MLQARQLQVSGHVSEAQEIYQRALLALNQQLPSTDALARFFRCAILFQLSSAYMSACRLDLCDRALNQAEELVESGDMIQVLTVVWLKGTARWHMGNFRGALACHQHESARELARKMGKWEWLAGSHCAAAKNALELGMLDLARDELDYARAALERTDVDSRLHTAYFTLCVAELQFRRGDLSEAAASFEKAHSEFEAIGHNRGKLNALVTSAKCHTLARGNPPRWEVVEQLMSQATLAEFHDLRARALRIMVYSILADPLQQVELDRVRDMVDPRMGVAPAVFLDGLVTLYGVLARRGSRDQELLRMARQLEPCVDQEYYLATMDAVTE